LYRARPVVFSQRSQHYLPTPRSPVNRLYASPRGGREGVPIFLRANQTFPPRKVRETSVESRAFLRAIIRAPNDSLTFVNKYPNPYSRFST
jgi:hypothetical protein